MKPPVNLNGMPSAAEAFRRFWRWWIGAVVLFPVMFLTNDFCEVPGSVFLALFFTLWVPAAMPCWRKRAPFGYWGLVCAASMGSTFVSVFLLVIVRLVMGAPIDGEG